MPVESNQEAAFLLGDLGRERVSSNIFREAERRLDRICQRYYWDAPSLATQLDKSQNPVVVSGFHQDVKGLQDDELSFVLLEKPPVKVAGGMRILSGGQMEFDYIFPSKARLRCLDKGRKLAKHYPDIRSEIGRLYQWEAYGLLTQDENGRLLDLHALNTTPFDFESHVLCPTTEHHGRKPVSECGYLYS